MNIKETQKETRFIKDNFPRLKDDFAVYAYVNLKIKNKQGQIQRFTFNKLQKKLWGIIQESLKYNHPVRLYFIKSRQTGSTTFFLGLIYWLCSLQRDKNAILIAHDDPTSESLGAKIQNYYLRSHPLLKPNVRMMNRKQVYFANSLEDYEKSGDIGLDCHLDNATANRETLGRSYTYQYALCSEFCFWESSGVNCKKTMGALFNAIPKIPGSMIILESTAQGEGYAKDFWYDENNGFTKIFISWVADDTYRKDVPFGAYMELSETKDSRYGDELRVKDSIEKELLYWDASSYLNNPVALHHEAMCRLAWRRMIIDENCQGDKEVFCQEYPLTAEEAFAGTATNVFPIDKIEEQRIWNKQLGAPKARGYNYNHDDSVTDPKTKFYHYKYGKLRVYEEPIDGCSYVIGGDGAQGIQGGDSSSLVVLRVPEMVEAASYEDIIAPQEFAALSSYLSSVYNNALLAIEINDKGGYATVDTIESDYPKTNLYRVLTNKPYKGKYFRSGWITNAISRSVMISDLKSLLTYDQIKIYNPAILEQLTTFVQHPDGKLAAATGKKDDLVLALMIAVQMAKQVHIVTKKEKPRKAPKGSADWLITQMNKRRSNMRIV